MLTHEAQADIGARLKIWRSLANLSQESAGQLFEVAQVTYGRWERGWRLDEQAIEKICRKAGITREWLVDGKGPPPIASERKAPGAKPAPASLPAEPKMIARPVRSLVWLPVLSVAQCSAQAWTPSMLEPVTPENWDGEMIPVEGPAKGWKALRAAGDSMEPFIMEGDVVIADTNTGPIDCMGRDVVLIGRDTAGDDMVMVKRLAANGDKGLVLESANPKYAPLRVPISQVKFVWRVMGIFRQQWRPNK